MKRIFVAISIILVVFLFSGCDADVLTAFGEWSLDLRDSGLVEIGNEKTDKAVEAAKSLMESIEENVRIASSLTIKYDLKFIPLLGARYKVNPSNGRYEFECKASFYGAKEEDVLSPEEEVLQKISEFITAIAQLKDFQENDSGLREVLETSYTGKTSSRPCHRNLYELVVGSETYATDVFTLVRSPLIPFSLSDLNSLKSYNSPIPLQTYDFSLLYSRLKNIVILAVPKTSTSSSGSSDMDFLVELASFFLSYLKEIENVVGDRSYKTVADVLTVFVILKILDSVDSVLTEMNVSNRTFDDEDYVSWLLSQCTLQVDEILGGIDAIAYIYDIEADSDALLLSLQKQL